MNSCKFFLGIAFMFVSSTITNLHANETIDLQAFQEAKELMLIKEELQQLRNEVEMLRFEIQKNQLELLNEIKTRLDQGSELHNQFSIPEVQQNSSAQQHTTLETEYNDNYTNQDEARAPVSLEEQTQFDNAYQLLGESQFQDANTNFQSIIDKWPNSTLADDAMYWIGEIHYINRQYGKSLEIFTNMLETYPHSQKLPDALLKIGYIQYDVGSYEDAANTFKHILTKFPGHQTNAPAQIRLKRIEETLQ